MNLTVVTTGGDLTAGVGLLDRLDAAEAAERSAA